MEKKQIIINNLLVTYYSKLNQNSKYNLVFLHGWRSKALVWNKIIESLEYSSYAIDLPGFGESQLPDKASTLQDFTNVVNEFITKLGLSNVVLVGHSNGGAISIKYIANNTSPIEKVVLIDSSGLRRSTPRKTIINTIAKIVKPIFKIPLLSPLRDRIYVAMGSEDYVAEPQLKETYLNMVGEDLSNDVQKVNIPALLIWGELDKSTPLKDGEFMHSQIKNSEFKIIQGADHFSFNHKDDLVVQYLNSFLG